MSDSPRSPTPATDEKPRLLVLASTYPRWPDDTEPGFVHELCLRLARHFKVRVVTPHAPGSPRKETMDGVEVRRYRYAPVRLQTLVNDGGIVTNLKRQPWKWLLVPNFLLSLLWTTWRQTRNWRPDVVHAHWLIPQGLVVAILSKFFFRNHPPFLMTSHGTDLNGLRFWPMPALKRFVARRASAVTVVSSAMLDGMKAQGIPTENTHIEPMGVDLRNRFTIDESEMRSAHEILFVGRLVEVKGVHFLIQAMPAIIENHPEAILTVAGFGPESQDLRQQVKTLGIENKVSFLGAVPQERLPTLYRRAAIFVAPFVQTSAGHQEGLGLVTIEAIGCGCPVLVSDIPATRGIIEDPDRRALPANSADLARKIIRILKTSPVSMQSTDSELRKHAIERFDWAQVASNYAELLHKLAN